MKTSVQTLIASALVAIFFFSTAFVTHAAPVVGIQKVIVKGNVRVILVQKDKESVKIYDVYNPEKTSVNMNGASLMISSNEDRPITVTVFVKNLFRIEASNTSTVETSGAFNLPFLQVLLNDEAKAKLNVKTQGLYTVVKDQSRLKLRGTSDDHILIRSKASQLQLEDFACSKTNSSFETLAVIDTAAKRAALPNLAIRNQF